MRVFDCHIHVQPWEQFNPAVRAVMAETRPDLAQVQKAVSDPEELLRKQALLVEVLGRGNKPRVLRQEGVFVGRPDPGAREPDVVGQAVRQVEVCGGNLEANSRGAIHIDLLPESESAKPRAS